METRKYVVTAAILATLAAGASAAYLTEDIYGAPRHEGSTGVALKTDEGVPRNMITALKADEGAPQNLVTAMKADEGIPQNLATAMKADEGVPQNLITG